MMDILGSIAGTLGSVCYIFYPTEKHIRLIQNVY